MVFGIGAAIKTVFKIRENKAKVGKLETLVAQLEHQQREPFFNVLSGIERFDTLLPLLDAAFAQKVKAVAKEELQKTPASRAEVAALGLALREVSVTLDKEIGSLRYKRGSPMSIVERKALFKKITKLFLWNCARFLKRRGKISRLKSRRALTGFQ